MQGVLKAYMCVFKLTSSCSLDQMIWDDSEFFLIIMVHVPPAKGKCTNLVTLEQVGLECQYEKPYGTKLKSRQAKTHAIRVSITQIRSFWYTHASGLFHSLKSSLMVKSISLLHLCQPVQPAFNFLCKCFVI